MGFSRQEYCSGLPFLSPEDLPNPGFEPESPAMQADSNINQNAIYKYTIIPYFKNNNTIHYGQEVVINKIKAPITNGRDDDWWINDL